MLVLLTSKWRQRAAAVLTVLYALCLVAPAAAFAFSDGSTPAHCLTVTDRHMAMDDGHAHHHDGMEQGTARHDNNDHGLPGKCCGLFCVTAIALSLEIVTEPAVHSSVVVATTAESLLGRSPNRIDRPPRALASL